MHCVYASTTLAIYHLPALEAISTNLSFKTTTKQIKLPRSDLVKIWPKVVDVLRLISSCAI